MADKAHNDFAANCIITSFSMAGPVNEVWSFTSNITSIGYSGFMLLVLHLMFLLLVLLFQLRTLVKNLFKFECTIVLYFVELLMVINYTVLTLMGSTKDPVGPDKVLTLEMIHQLFWSSKYLTLQKQELKIMCCGQQLFIGGEVGRQTLSTVPSLDSHPPSGTIIVKISPNSTPTGSQGHTIEPDPIDDDLNDQKSSKFPYFLSKKDRFSSFHDIKKDFKEFTESGVLTSFAPAIVQKEGAR